MISIILFYGNYLKHF